MIDVQELEKFAVDVTNAPRETHGAVVKTVFKAAMNIKTGMQAEFGRSQHFRSISGSVDFDFADYPNHVQAEIGPRHGSGEPGNLANIAYFGTSRGGGTVDFLAPFEREKPVLERHLEAVLGDVL